MPAVVRQGDATKGHPGGNPHGPRTLFDPASDNVFINGKAAVRKTDKVLPPHTPPGTPNPITSGSSTVFANGLELAREGDAISCGDECKDGSSDVNAG